MKIGYPHIIRYALVIISAIYLVFHFLYLWIAMNIDSPWFYVFAQYIKTGFFEHFMQYTYQLPMTTKPPLYSLFLAILWDLPYQAEIIHLTHLLLFALELSLLYRMLKKLTGITAASLAVLIFMFIPGNVTFLMYVMSEIPLQVIFTLYLYLIYRYSESKNLRFLSVSVFIGFLMTFLNYAFGVYGVISLLFFVLKKPSRPVNYLFPVVGIIMIAVWVIINHAITGMWGLSDTGGLRYNITASWQAGLTPPPDDPAVREIRKYVPPEVSLAQPYWVLEPYINPVTGNDYARLNRLVGDVGKAAIRAHPWQFLKYTAFSFYKSHDSGVPYMPNLGQFGLPFEQTDTLYCGLIKGIRFCSPIISTPHSFSLFNRYISYANVFYDRYFMVWSVWIFFPCLALALASGNRTLSYFAGLFIVGRLVMASSNNPQARYLVPYYPLMILITVMVLYDLYMLVRRLKIFILKS